MQHADPLRVVFRTFAPEAQQLEPDQQRFSAGFRYPGQNFSSQEGSIYQSVVEWEEKKRRLIVTTAIGGVLLSPWQGIERFLSALNVEILPFLDEGGEGCLRAHTSTQDSRLVVPVFEFRLPCGRAPDEVIQRIFLEQLYNRAALALWLSRTVFRYIAAVGAEPTAEERLRLLQIEHGRFHLHLKEPDERLLPRGFYENLYGRNQFAQH